MMRKNLIKFSHISSADFSAGNHKLQTNGRGRLMK